MAWGWAHGKICRHILRMQNLIHCWYTQSITFGWRGLGEYQKRFAHEDYAVELHAIGNENICTHSKHETKLLEWTKDCRSWKFAPQVEASLRVSWQLRHAKHTERKKQIFCIGIEKPVNDNDLQLEKAFRKSVPMMAVQYSKKPITRAAMQCPLIITAQKWNTLQL